MDCSMPGGIGGNRTRMTSSIGGLEDILDKDLTAVFCGINPGLLAAAQGHHFAGRGNRFWRTLHLAGFTSTQIRPEESRSILNFDCGLTTVVARATASADELSIEDFRAAAEHFESKINLFTPRWIAFLGKVAYSGLSGRRRIEWGRQSQTYCGSSVWVLPNPSGRNLAFDQMQLEAHYREFHSAAFG